MWLFKRKKKPEVKVMWLLRWKSPSGEFFEGMVVPWDMSFYHEQIMRERGYTLILKEKFL